MLIRARRDGIGAMAVALAWLALLGSFHLLYRGFFPNESGRVGHDFASFLPAYLDGYLWFAKNGPFAVPWFTPSFCAGLPVFADPQSGYYSVPQWLTFVIDPLAASYLTLLIFASLGYFGMYRLSRTVFALPRSLSLLAAGLYFLNGFLPHRIVVGENSFHALTLVPWIAFWLLRPAATRLASAGYAALAGLAGSYCVLSGMNILVFPAALSVVAVMLIHGLGHPYRGDCARRVVVSLAVCLGVSASKLAASFAFLSHFPRTYYALPGIPDVPSVLRVVALALFASSEATTRVAQTLLTNVQWTVLPHEWAYQFSAAPLLAMLVVLLLPRAADVPPSSVWRAERCVAGATLGLLLLIPPALLYYTPSVNQFYKAVPFIRSSSWPMRWLVVYVPLLPLATALILRRPLAGRPRMAAAVTAATLGLTLVLNFAEPRDYYHHQPYDPRPVLSAYERFSAGAAERHAIRAVGVFMSDSGQTVLPLNRNDAFLFGVSPILCYNAIFGYRLERFPTEGLTIGSVLRADRGHLNFKNPACYLYPRENGCLPGDHFRTEEIDSLKTFVEYRPLPFAASAVQIAADWTTDFSLVGTGAFLTIWAVVVPRRGRGSVERRGDR